MYNKIKLKIYEDTQTIKYIKFYYDNKYHNDSGPAVVKYNKEGNLIYEAYYIFGKLSRLYSHAKYKKYDNGDVKLMYYYKGKLHNKYGPAIIKKNTSGKIIYEAYYENGYRILLDGLISQCIRSIV